MYNTETGYGGQGDFEFSDKTIRMGFIRKVYGILMSQIAVTVAIVALFTYHEGTKMWVQHNPTVLLVAIIVSFGTLLSLVCCGDLRRKAPMNFICLGIFTLAEGFLVGCITSMYAKDEVFLAALITLVITIALTMFAFQTKVDFTDLGGILFFAFILLMVFGIGCMFYPNDKLNLVYASLGALLFSIYIIYDTQIMIGGNYKYSISPEEYVFAALNLYMDVINLFLYILKIIASSRD